MIAQPLVVINNDDMARARWLWPDKDKLKPRDFAYIVIGLPRSGTTLVCKILKELGVEWLSEDYSGPDWTSDSAQYLEQAPPFVFNSMCELKESSGKAAKGMKWLLPLTQIQLSFLMTVRTKVIFCLRDLDEVGRSTKRHFKGLRPYDDTTLAFVLQKEMAKLQYFIKPEDIMQVNFHQLLEDPWGIISGISARIKLGNIRQIKKAAAIVDPSMPVS